MHDKMQAGALRGVRVLDLTTVFMGPYATQMLGDLGADVIKVEQPGDDLIRGIGPGGEQGLGALFLNRNKRSVVLDLKKAAGREALLKLAAGADVLVYNVRPQAMERLGLGYEALRETNPRLIYVGAFGYGQGGRYEADPAFDDLIQAASGFSHALAQVQDDQPGFVPVTIADRSVGLYAFGSICAALYAREKTGQGQRIDVPMFETMTHLVMSDHLYGRSFEPARAATGYPRLLAQSRRPYKTEDGYLARTIYTDAHWENFFAAIGDPSCFHDDPRLKDLATRTEHIAELYEMVEHIMELRPTQQWMQLLRAADIPHFQVHTFDSLRDDLHLAEVGFYTEHERPQLGRITGLRHPAEWKGTPATVRSLAPMLGEHTREVLGEAGYSPQEISVLLAAGAGKAV
ncbi:MAG: CoA transferase [Candidatus Protistobacter heckmanni]|nr:CoA transferase [Candidatus Protistobacter heckmanni]